MKTFTEAKKSSTELGDPKEMASLVKENFNQYGPTELSENVIRFSHKGKKYTLTVEAEIPSETKDGGPSA